MSFDLNKFVEDVAEKTKERPEWRYGQSLFNALPLQIVGIVRGSNLDTRLIKAPTHHTIDRLFIFLEGYDPDVFKMSRHSALWFMVNGKPLNYFKENYPEYVLPGDQLAVFEIADRIEKECKV